MKKNFTESLGNINLQHLVYCLVIAGIAFPYLLEASSRKSISYHIISEKSIKVSGSWEADLNISNITARVAQTVEGTATDESGQGLPGVNIRLKNNLTVGTITDIEGHYALEIPEDIENPVLIFSFVGYLPQEIEVSNRSVIDVKLTTDVTSLEEVVVIGYGTQRREEVTSSVATVSPEEFNKGNITDVSQLLQGKVAGLSIARPGGNPNGDFVIRLRGLSTLGANTQPLIVVDGMIGANINTVDPNDIASIDVLKDAASSAIYGTRGSAGVIIVTTKTGKFGEPRISYNGSVTADNPYRFTPNMSAQEYRDLGIGADYGANTDWYDEISGTAISQTHSLSLSGGSNTTSYNASVNYRNNKGIAIKTGFEQLNGRFNLTQLALKEKLTLKLNLSATRRNADLGFNEAFKYATIFNPTAPVHSDDPLYDLSGGGYFESNFVDYANPVAVLEQNSNEEELQRFNFTASAEYEILENLKFLLRYGQQTVSSYRNAYFPRTSFHSRNWLGISGFARQGYAWKSDEENYSQLFESIITYNKELGDLNLSAVAGYSYQDFLNKSFTVQGGNFITDESAEDFSNSLDFENGRAIGESFKDGSRLVAFFGRVNLNYDDFAFLSASLRREGSTQFGANNKWGMFPAVSAGVDITRFITLPALNQLKFRASYGVTGALPPESYLSLLTLEAGDASFYIGNGNYIKAYEPDKNPNPDLKWEKKAEFDIGLDFSLLDNRLTGTMDYYNRTTSDLIFNVTVPVPPNLVPNTWKNIGKLESSGFEFSLGYNVINKEDFTWNTSGNFSTYKVHLAELDPSLKGSYVGASNLGTPGQEATQITRAVEGEDIGILWGWVYEGVAEDGSYDLADRDDDGDVDAADQTIIGNGLPDFEFGWTNNFRYKNFDLNFFFRSSIGHDLINTYRAFYENPNVASSYNVVKTEFYNPEITDGQIFSSLFVEDASFIKLDNATLGYTVPISEGSLFKSIRAYITGQNLFVITDYSGVDPEVRYDYDDDLGTPGTNVLAPGVDPRESWVLARSYTLGVSLTF